MGGITRINQLPTADNVTTDDLIIIMDNPSGTATTKSISAGTFLSYVSGLTVNAANVVYTSGNQTIGGIKTFNGELLYNAGSDISIEAISDTFTINTSENGSPLAIYNTTLAAYSFIVSAAGDVNCGKITVGEWNATPIAPNYGGTGRTSYSNGQLLIGSGTSLVANTLTAGSGISISNGAGSITISATGGVGSVGVTGTGTTNYLSKWISNSGIGNSLVYDNGTNLGIGTITPSGKLHVVGTGIISTTLNIGRNTPYSITDITTITPQLNVGGVSAFLGGNIYVSGVEIKVWDVLESAGTPAAFVQGLTTSLSFPDYNNNTCTLYFQNGLLIAHNGFSQ